LTIHFRGAATAGEVACRFDHKWPTTTRHLRVLENAGLLRHERRGRTRVYTVDKTRLALVSKWLGWFESPAAVTAEQHPPQSLEGDPAMVTRGLDVHRRARRKAR
jgi:DNA-binding transcriptional ArsR family regulator